MTKSASNESDAKKTEAKETETRPKAAAKTEVKPYEAPNVPSPGVSVNYTPGSVSGI